MSRQSPHSPLRSDYRMIRYLLSREGGGIVHITREYDLIGDVFEKAGGSWVSLFSGSPKDMDLLKKVIRAAVRGGFVTKSGMK